MRLLVSFILIVLTLNISAQEFDCNIQVTAKQVQGTDKDVFDKMQTALMEFVNNRQWTNYEFKLQERIECNIVINIMERPSTDVFKGTFSIVASRPIYNTAYNSTLFNYIDRDFDFQYSEYQPLEFQENTHMSNLTSVVAYYLYFVLGLDFDSFSPMGGNPFFEKAELVMNAAQNAPEAGWKAFESQRNRYWLIENYLNNSYADLRSFLYNYHLKGLDEMSENKTGGRTAILESLKSLQTVHENKPGLFALSLMLDAKRDEIVNIFTEGNPTEKTNVIEIMKEIDPANTSTYSQINKRN